VHAKTVRMGSALSSFCDRRLREQICSVCFWASAQGVTSVIPFHSGLSVALTTQLQGFSSPGSRFRLLGVSTW
jgi:hypothetical protein